MDALKRVLPFADYDCYLCGPGQFMRDLYEGLRGLNVADERIRFEAFGPASVKRTTVVEVQIEPGAALICMAHPVAGDPGAGAGVTLDLRGRRTIAWPTSRAASVSRLADLGARSARQAAQRAIAIATGRRLDREGFLAECNHLESGSRRARRGDTPMPAAILLEYMQNSRVRHV